MAEITVENQESQEVLVEVFVENQTTEVEIHVDFNGAQAAIDAAAAAQAALAEIQSIGSTGILAKGTITRVDNDFTFSVGFIWKILSTQYQNAAPIVITIPEATAGFFRKDFAVLNNANQIVRVAGTEDDSEALDPEIPAGTIFLTSWTVFGDVIDEPTEPIVGDEFIKKAEFAEVIITGSGPISLPLNSEQTTFRIISDAITTIEGTTPSLDYTGTIGYTGKFLLIINGSNTPKTVKHDDTAWQFRFSNEEDFVLGPREVLTMRQTKTSVPYFDLFSTGRVASGEVTMADVEAAEQSAKDYADSIVVGLWDDRGPYNPTTNSNLYPTFNGSGTAGAVLKGDLYTISGLGSGITTTVGSKEVQDGDTVRALSDAPGQTESNWAIAENNIGYVAENSANKTDDESTSITEAAKYFSVKGFWNSIKLKFFANIPAKATPIVDADTIALGDSEDSGKTKTRTWAQFKANLLTYFSSLFEMQYTNVTTLTVVFSAKNIHYSAASPATGNIAVDLTNAKTGLIQKMYHQNGSEPTYPAGFVKKYGSYSTTKLNEIYFEWAGGSRVEYWIVTYP